MMTPIAWLTIFIVAGTIGLGGAALWVFFLDRRGD
jgi:hypothetical protein